MSLQANARRPTGQSQASKPRPAVIGHDPHFPPLNPHKSEGPAKSAAPTSLAASLYDPHFPPLRRA